MGYEHGKNMALSILEKYRNKHKRKIDSSLLL